MEIVIKKKHLEKEKLFARLVSKDANIKKEVEEAINNNGAVYGLKKSGEIKGVSIFVPDVNNAKVLNHTKDLYLEDLTDKQKRKFVKSVENRLSESISYGRYEKVEWDNKIFSQKRVKIGPMEVGIGVLFIIAGAVAAIITKEYTWLLIGLAIGLGLGTVVSEVNKK